MQVQEDIEQRTVSITVQASKLTGRVLKAAIAAALQKMEQERNTPKVGRNSMKRLTARDPGANTIEVTGRIRSFERIAKKHEVRYHIEKDPGTDPERMSETSARVPNTAGICARPSDTADARTVRTAASRK